MSGSALIGLAATAVETAVTLLASPARHAYQLSFQVCPIFFTNGIAGNNGGMMPVTQILQPGTPAPSLTGLIEAAVGLGGPSLDQAFAHFRPVPGGTLAKFSPALYPFANQQVAANAIIFEPLTISLRMEIPVNTPGGFQYKFVTMSALQAALKQHANLGGTYTVATPAFIYSNALLLDVVDVSAPDSAVPQSAFQWNFLLPLVTLQAAQAAQSTFMTNVTNGTPTSGSTTPPATSSAVPSVTTGSSAAGAGVPSGVTGSPSTGTVAPAPSAGETIST